jgi:hypothetical protein
MAFNDEPMLTGRPDIIELGVPFTDPIADGPTIQTSNTVRRSIIQLVRDRLTNSCPGGVEKWYYHDLVFADGTRCAKSRTQGTNSPHGLLQPHHELWGPAIAEGLQGGGSQWLHCR